MISEPPTPSSTTSAAKGTRLMKLTSISHSNNKLFNFWNLLPFCLLYITLPKPSVKYDAVNNVLTQDDTIYNVKYKAYMNDNILSLVILSELKEGDNNQRIIIKTYNYDLKENKEATINDIISSHNIDTKQANSLIKNIIDSSQDENLKLRDLGYPIDVRDSNSDEYKIENAKNYYLGDNGYLFLVYPYGNKELTSEMDLVIIR